MTSYWAFTWLLHGAAASTILLAMGVLAVSICRQPADRLRVIQWSLAATLCALVLVAVPQFAAFSLGLLGSAAAPLPALSAPATARVSSPAPPSAEPIVPARRASPAEIADFPQIPASSPADPRPAPAHQPAPAAPINLAAFALPAICIAYALGALVFLIRWARARRQLVRLLQNAREVPAAVQAQLSRIAGAEAKRIHLLAAEIAGPVTWGTHQPVIVIPSAVLQEPDDVRLRYYLAHEWAHVSRRDFATWQFSTLLQILLYYQPLFWWLRRQLAICMDQLADADASDQGESTVDYADFLVQVARLRLAPNPQLTLGIGDRRSSLHLRVVFLLNAVSRPRPTCPPARSLAIGAAAILLAAFISVVRLDAQPAAGTPNAGADQNAAKTKPESQSKTPPSEDKPAAEAITYEGTVIDAATAKPIPGVKVSVWRKVSRPWRLIETTEHETDAAGRYSFVIPPAQAAEPYLYLEVEAHHPNYASKSRSGYSHAMIKKNLAAGDPPFYSTIRLWPGEAVTGTIVDPAGEPLPDVKVSIYSATNQSKEFLRGAWDGTRTDANGVFRIVAATPGDGVLWIKPEQYSLQAHRLGDRRGDWGRLTVEKGPELSGRVLDVQGAPVAGVQIEARRKGDGEKPDEFLNQNSVAGQITREAVSGPQGEFTLASLPDGDYSLQVESVRAEHNYDPPPLAQVFLRQNVAIVDGAAPESLELRAVPHVVIQGTYLDSAGQPRAGSEVSIFGRIDGGFYHTESSVPGSDGKFEAKVPHGLEQVEISQITNEHSSLRWRLSADEPLKRGRRIKLGTLEDDLAGLQVVRYTAPILLVKPVDEQGALVADCAPILKYTRDSQGTEELSVYTDRSNVSFEKQPDGRSRSEQLLPDEPASVTVTKPGYTTTAQELSLAEGAERELVFVMKKDPQAASAANKDKKEGE